MERFKLNVGGSVFEIQRESLLMFPVTLLGSLTKSSPYYDINSDSFFFNRNPEFFNHILDLYRTGVLHLPSGVCSAIIRAELEFWKLPLNKLCLCCQHEYFKYEREMELFNLLKRTFESGDLKYDPEGLQKSKLNQVLNKIWLFFDQPKSSIYARVFSVIFLLVVLTSTISFLLGSRADFRDLREVFKDESVLPHLVKTSSIRFFNELNINNSKEVMFATTIPKPALNIIDLICTIFFSVEFAFHFLSCPKKLRFFTYPLNVIDTLLVIDMITLYILDLYIETLVHYYAVVQLYLILRALIVLRLCRLFRFMRRFNGFRILTLSLRASAKEFGLLFVIFLLASAIFASLIYYAEFYTPDTFPDIPHAIWWSIVTMTTVGYGDQVPKSGYGYVVGTLCAFGGIIILALPIAVVATNFNDLYDKNKEREDRYKLQKQDDSQTSSNHVKLTKVVPIMEEASHHGNGFVSKL